MTKDSPLNRAIWISLAEASYASADTIPDRLAEQRHIIGHWHVRWLGISHDQSNLVYVAQNPDEGIWAVVIRGSLTHPLEKGFWTDWVMEDMQVLKQVPVPFEFGDSNAKIAAGMQVAFDHIMTMQNQDLNLKEFLLESLQASNDQLWFVGHSLGGAVVPILAAWYQTAADKEGALGNRPITPISFAGPTSGNPAFAAGIEQRFEGFPLRFVNDLDMVPHTWSKKGLSWIIRSYKPQPRIPSWFRLVCRLVRGWMWLHGVRYDQPGDGQVLPGQLLDEGQWFSEVNEQHSPDTYYRLVGPHSLDK